MADLDSADDGLCQALIDIDSALYSIREATVITESGDYELDPLPVEYWTLHRIRLDIERQLILLRRYRKEHPPDADRTDTPEP